MTYDLTESSRHSGEPVELYKFVRGVTRFLYTSGTTDVTYNSETYTPITISRSGIEQNDEINRNDLKVHVPRDLDVADQFRVFPPASIVSITVFRFHPADGNFKAIWVGRILSTEWKGVKATLTCESVFSSLKRTGLRRNYQAMCPHVLYGAACGVNQLSNQTTDNVTAIGTGTISVPAVSGFADDYFAGGFVRFFTATGLGDTRFITGHTTDTLTIVSPFQTLQVGDSVNVYPGCKHTTDDCENKYSNLVNYGGFPYIPGENPFDGINIS